jgi:phage gpG-like protein
LSNDLNRFRRDVQRMSREISSLRGDLPRIGGTMAIKFVHSNFQKEMFQGKPGQSWKGRAPGSPRASRKLLRDRNILFDSIEYRKTGALGFKVYVDLGVVPYAKIHNEGGTVTVTRQMQKYFWAMFITTGDAFYKRLALMKVGKVIKIPKRQYMGFSPVLDEMIEKELDFQMDKIFE